MECVESVTEEVNGVGSHDGSLHINADVDDLQGKEAHQSSIEDSFESEPGVHSSPLSEKDNFETDASYDGVKKSDSPFSSPTHDLVVKSSSINSLSTTPSIVITPSETTSSFNDDTPSIQVTTPGGGVVSSSSISFDPSLNSTENTDHVCDSDEEYFEEYHLPNTHENAFVRHLSFRRKVQTTPINAPDAERIEGLVRTGEFVRHASIRKKIVPEEELERHPEVEEEYYEEEEYEEEEEDNDDQEAEKSSCFSKRIERDIREIERYLSEENSDVSNTDIQDHPSSKETPKSPKLLKRITSTPKTIYTGSDMEVCSTNGDINGGTDVAMQDSELENQFDDSLRIEDSTLRKIQQCLDFSSYKDLLNLSGKLSDLLSPKEVEDVLMNSERYRQYLDTEVFEALSLSFQGQSQSLPYDINVNVPSPKLAQNSNLNTSKSIVNTDSGFSSPKTPKEDNDEKEGESGECEMKDSKVRRNSIGAIEAESVTKEHHSFPSNLKKIHAPELNLDLSTDTKHEENDINVFPVEEKVDKNVSSRKRLSVTEGILDAFDCSDDVSVGWEAVEEKKSELTNGMMEVSCFPVTLSSSMDTPPLDMFPSPPPPDLIPELSAAEEMSEVRHWRNVVIGGAWRRIDMKVITPYRKCITHGGYMEENRSPIVVLSASLLPDKTRKDYNYVMDNLFMYVLSFLEQLVADDYILVYFSGGKRNGSGPGFHWMRRAYEMIDRRLRKNLNSLLLVHPSLWAKTLVTLSRPFISSKFYRKLHFVPHLTDLAQMVPLEQLDIPDVVKQADFEIMIKEKLKAKR